MKDTVYNNILSKKTHYIESMYLFLLLTTLVVSFISNTTFMEYIPIKFFNRINYIVLFFLVVKIYLFDKYNLIELMGITTVIIVSVISWRVTNITSVMIMVIFILAAKNVHFQKVIRCYFDVNFLMLLLVTSYALVGIIRNLTYLRQGMYRFSLGIDYPTDYAAYIFYLILAYVYLNYKKISFFHYIIFFIIGVALYFITNARLDVITILLVIPIIIIAKRAERAKDKVSRMIVANFWGLTIILPYVYFLFTYYFSWSSKAFMKLNTLLSGRLAYGYIAMQKYPLRLISQRVKEQGWGGIAGLNAFQKSQSNYFFIDSSFIRLLVIYGLILTCFFMVALLKISLKGTINHKYVMPAIILLITISCLIDQHLMEITFNPFLLAFLATTNTVKKSIANNGEELANDDKTIE
ncbi:polymerase [Limosilactobacillus vaginalis]|uniref:polymerase n=1 Tax=Limosilactobacillus vaginalis TaxID=1633 RepID=UPI003F233FD5